MATKQDILNNMREYSSDQLVEAIRNGVVTMYELSKSGNLTPLMRRRLEAKLEAGDSGKADDETAGASGSAGTDIPGIIVIDDPIQPPEDTTNHRAGQPKPEPKPATDKYGGRINNRGLFKRPFAFKGRIRRLEYGLSLIISYVIMTPIYLCFVELYSSYYAHQNKDLVMGFNLVFLGSYFFYCWFLLAQGCKRCHDRGHNGWWQFIPFYGFWLLFASGDQGDNRYGNSPKK